MHYKVDLDDDRVLALALVQRWERFEIVGYKAAGGGSIPNVWFIHDTFTDPATIIGPPFTNFREAQIARAQHILEVLFREFGFITIPD